MDATAPSWQDFWDNFSIFRDAIVTMFFIFSPHKVAIFA